MKALRLMSPEVNLLYHIYSSINSTMLIKQTDVIWGRCLMQPLSHFMRQHSYLLMFSQRAAWEWDSQAQQLASLIAHLPSYGTENWYTCNEKQSVTFNVVFTHFKILPFIHGVVKLSLNSFGVRVWSVVIKPSGPPPPLLKEPLMEAAFTQHTRRHHSFNRLHWKFPL